ncbi:MAG: putative colanic acid biosynthesis UDP-glucose lipid carrier transferase [Myxococcota bacterium]|jgi:putative colanic acid biosynthesis UDP-glucose lipid carrier transferase
MSKKLLKNNFDVIYTVLQVWLDGIVVLAACFAGFFAYNYWFPVEVKAHLSDYRQLFVVITGIVLSCSWLLGMYHSRKSILNVEEYRAIYKSVLISFLLTSTCMYMLRSMDTIVPPESAMFKYLQYIYQPFEIEGSSKYSRVMYLVIFIFSYVFLTIERALMFGLLKRLHSRGVGNTNIAIVGTSETAVQLYKKMEIFPTLGYNLLGFISHKSEADDTEQQHLSEIEVLGDFKNLLGVTRKNHIHRVVVVCPSISENELEQMCRTMERYQIDYQVLPRLSHFLSRRFTVETFDNMPLISPVELGTRPVYCAIKRGIDLTWAVVGLLVAVVLFPLVALAIRLESPGSIFFTQFRMGVGNSTFRMIKFRTMYADKCGDDVTPQGSDMRVTKVGRLLRKTSLDELPQLVNILRGEMSLIGPRPEMPFIVENYDKMQMQRLDIRPGITGLWQVSDKRKSPIHENIDYDLYYIQNQSVFLDLTIAVLTFTTVFNMSSTE